MNLNIEKRDSDDDNLQEEWEKLADSESLLSQELNELSEHSSFSEHEERAGGSSSEHEEEAGGRRESTSSSSKGVTYTLFDHYTFLKLSEVPNLGFVCDVSDHLLQSEEGHNNDIKEFCEPISDEALASTYYGLGELAQDSLPVRTLTIRIRPDVLCGAVMDSVFASVEACSDHSLRLLKRQGGHLRAVVVNGKVPFVVDAQLCTSRFGNYQRLLVLRFYYATSSELAEVEFFSSIGGKEYEMPSEKEQNWMNLHVRGAQMNLHLREACALVQLINNKRGALNDNSWADSGFPWSRRINSPRQACTYLTSSFRWSPSVRSPKRRFSGPSIVLPSLSRDDWMVIQSSWSLCDRIWRSLADTCAYSSLSSTPIEIRSELCGLDFQYCMQMFSLSEERMLSEVQQVVNKLHWQVDQAEKLNKVFADVTKPMFKTYGIEGIEDTEAMDLFPPDWADEDGPEPQTFNSLAKEALAASEISSKESIVSKTNQEVAEGIVRIVYSAYNCYHNLVQTERVKRANGNILTRLFKKQLWLQELYKRLRDSFMISKDALHASKACYQLAQDANIRKSSRERLRLVPMLTFDLDGGKCYVTATHVLFSLKRRFNKNSSVLLFDLNEIDLKQISPSLLQIVMMGNDELLLQFRPAAIDASRLKTFIEVLQSLQGEDISEERLI